MMRKYWITQTIFAAGAAALMLTGVMASEITSGQWAMQRSDQSGMVQFTMQGSAKKHSFSTTSDWPTSSFSGLDVAQDTQFTLTRDAGTFEFDGTLRNSAGGGTFQFSADPGYPQEMKALGFDVVRDNQIHFAMHDVSLNFAREMKNANLRNLDADKLLVFRIHGVSRKFIEDLKAAGQDERNSDHLIAFRIHGVTPEMIQRVRADGYTPDSGMLIAFRIHGVTPEFIDEVRKLGFERPQPEQLLSMRIHGVTPEYIGEMQGRGVKNLTIDKLVAMKIHGLD